MLVYASCNMLCTLWLFMLSVVIVIILLIVNFVLNTCSSLTLLYSSGYIC